MYSLEDFRAGSRFINGDGEYITEEEAQAEVDWLNKVDAAGIRFEQTPKGEVRRYFKITKGERIYDDD